MSKSLKRQQGMSTLLLMFILVSLAFFGLVGVKVVPMYTNDLTIKSVLEDIENDPAVPRMSVDKLHYTIMNRLQINSVYNLKNKDVVVKKEDGKITVDVDYFMRDNIYRNLDAIATFKHHIEIKAAEEE